jgi:hypothetical protein
MNIAADIVKDQQSDERQLWIDLVALTGDPCHRDGAIRSLPAKQPPSAEV